MKNDKTKLIIWAVVALVIGVIIGTFLIAPAVTGNAKKIAGNLNSSVENTLDDSGSSHIWECCCDSDDPAVCPPYGCICKTITTGTSIKTTTYTPVN